MSITNPSIDSPLEYFFGKARLERTLIDSGLPYSILRPAVLFGREDILINNIAWALRKVPAAFHFRQRRVPLAADFRGRFRQAGRRTRRKDRELHIDAIGPETFTYRSLVRMIGQAIGKNRPLLVVPPFLGYLASKLVGWLKGDVMTHPG